MHRRGRAHLPLFHWRKYGRSRDAHVVVARLRNRGAPVKLGRIFANAIARRVAYVVVAAALAWLGLGDARAQACSTAYTVAADACPDQGSAHAAADAAARAYVAWSATANDVACYHNTTTNSVVFAVRLSGSCTGLINRYYTRTFPAGTGCSSRPSETTQFMPLGGSTQCWNGCEVRYAQNGDDTTSTRSPTGMACGADYRDKCAAGSVWNGYMNVCQPMAPDCPEGQTRVGTQCEANNKCPDGMVAVQPGTAGAINQGALYCKPADDTCPPGNVKSPTGQCLPGDGQCAAGEARRPNGTCGRDADGDGQADDDDDRDDNDTNKPQASGGDSCQAPPSCSGNAIDCMQVKIQWRIDCNTRSKVNVTGGACTATPVCVGENCKAMEYSSLLMQWRTACALEKLKIPGAGEGSEGEKIKPDFEALAAGGDGANPDDSIFLPDGDGESFNESLVSYGSGALGWNFSIEGQQFTMPQQIKDWLPAIRWLIIAGATLVGIGIAWGKL